MDANKTVEASFSVIQRVLKINKKGTGTGTIKSTPDGIDCTSSCNAKFDDKTDVTLVAYPDLNSIFSGWKGAGCFGTGVCSVSMNTTKAITATFTANYILSLTKTGNGAVTGAKINCGSVCSASYNKATTIKLTATPSNGANFIGWSGACTGTESTCTVTVNATSPNKTVSASFTQ